MPTSRTSRSDEGILALTTSVLKHILGLNDETVSRILKIVRNQGQWQDLKVQVRSMSGVAHRRLNDVINMAQDADPTTLPDDEVDQDVEGFNVDHERGQYDHEGHGHVGQRTAPGTRYEFEEVREAMTFANFLLNELSYDIEDLRDPENKQEIQRIMRASPEQAQQLAKRAQQEEKRDQRQQVATATDPQRAQLLRKKENLQRQLQQIDQQLENMGTTQ